MGHPHTDGLVAHYLFNGRALSVSDLTQNQNDSDVVGAEYVPEGLRFDGNNKYSALDNTKQRVNSEAGTIIIKFRSLSSFGDSVSRCLFGSYGTSAEGDFVVLKLSDNNLYFLLRDTGGEHWVRISEPPGWETGVQVSVLWNRSKAIWNSDNMVININGVHTTPQASGSETSWNSFTVTSDLYVGNDADNTNDESNGIVEWLSIRNKVLSAGQLKDIHEDPYNMFGYVKYM